MRCNYLDESILSIQRLFCRNVTRLKVESIILMSCHFSTFIVKRASPNPNPEPVETSDKSTQQLTEKKPAPQKRGGEMEIESNKFWLKLNLTN